MPNIQSILDELGIPYRTEHHHVSKNWVGVDCCFCSPRSNRFRLGISLSGGYCNCWTCGGHRLIDVLVDTTGRSYRECSELLKGVEAGRVGKALMKKGKLVVPSSVGPLMPQHRKYLERRGFDPNEIARLWGVRGIGIDARTPWTIWIPIHFRSEVVSWTTRSIGGSVRYVNANVDQESISAKSLLYGEDLAREAIVVCEGPLDAWAIGPGAVAVMGLSYSRDQLLKIVCHPVRAICFDADGPGRKRASRLASELESMSGETTIIRLETGKDPAEVDKDEVKAIRERFLK